MREVVVERVLSKEQARALKGSHLERSQIGLVLRSDSEPIVVRRADRPDGPPLCIWVPGSIPRSAVLAAREVFRHVRGSAANRSTALGAKRTAKFPGGFSVVRPEEHWQELDNVVSGVIGYMDRSHSVAPICRETSFNLDQPELFARAVPFIRAVGAVFRQWAPDRWAAQMAEVEATHPAWVIPGSPFTTVTVNRNFRTAVHTDAGDLPAGYGCMSAIRSGSYSGGETCFPAYSVGVDMLTGGVMLADVHEWHANLEIEGQAGRWERLAAVLYYRRRMRQCGSPEEEAARAAARVEGEPLWD